MDPISQGVVGAALAQALVAPVKRDSRVPQRPVREVRWATLAGVAAGMAADLDIFIRSKDDPLLSLEFHRHFTHSLLFIPLGAVLVAAILWLWVRRSGIGFGKWALWCLAGYATAAPLDACTSYGTRLLWPFSDRRVAWDLIAIVDPVFTLTGLALVIMAFRRGAPVYARGAVLFFLLYLGVGWLQRDRAADALRSLAESRGHGVERLVVRPTLGNLLLWRGTYVADGHLHVDAVRAGWAAPLIYEGEAVPLVVLDGGPVVPEGTVAAQDLRRFDHFSDGWLVRHPDDGTVIGDGRYSVGADEVRPLWGIRIDPLHPNRHVEYVTFRSVSGRQWDRFWHMLAGRPPESMPPRNP